MWQLVIRTGEAHEYDRDRGMREDCRESALKAVVRTLVDEKMGIMRHHSEEGRVPGCSIDNAKLDLSDRWFLLLETDCASSIAWRIIRPSVVRR
jgi:hypothetical protein